MTAGLLVVGTGLLVPVATTDEVLRLLAVVTDDPETTAEVGSLVGATPDGFVGQPRRARWVHPFAHRHIGYLAGRRALVLRRGFCSCRASARMRARRAVTSSRF